MGRYVIDLRMSTCSASLLKECANEVEGVGGPDKQMKKDGIGRREGFNGLLGMTIIESVPITWASNTLSDLHESATLHPSQAYFMV